MAMISIAVSLVVAFATRTNLIRILSTPAEQWYANTAAFSWDVRNWSAAEVLGRVLAGVALAFGSRTWHDLAEQLQVWKQKKRELLAAGSTETQQDKRTTRRELAEAAIESNDERWFAEYEDLCGVSVGVRERDGIETGEVVILFEVDEKREHSEKSLPSSVEFGGTSFHTDVIATGEPATSDYRLNQAGDILMSRLPAELGAGAFRTGHDKTVGTLGLRVCNEDGTFAVTCMHVTSPDSIKRAGASGATDVAKGSEQDDVFVLGAEGPLRVGAFHRAVLQPSRGLDVALVRVEAQQLSEQTFGFPKAPTGFRHVSQWHADNRLAVHLVGHRSRDQHGRVLAPDARIRITYGRRKLLMKNLIRTSRISKGGDSGAAVMDRDHRVIGVLIATSRRFSYVMPITTVLNSLDVRLDTAR
jgi:hypothetical protein